tara:strand:- start:12 stop:521 length:510 start_codon:yes stop_codon:yes gene_type:complete
MEVNPMPDDDFTGMSTEMKNIVNDFLAVESEKFYNLSKIGPLARGMDDAWKKKGDYTQEQILNKENVQKIPASLTWKAAFLSLAGSYQDLIDKFSEEVFTVGSDYYSHNTEKGVKNFNYLYDEGGGVKLDPETAEPLGIGLKTKISDDIEKMRDHLTKRYGEEQRFSLG